MREKNQEKNKETENSSWNMQFDPKEYEKFAEGKKLIEQQRKTAPTTRGGLNNFHQTTGFNDYRPTIIRKEDEEEKLEALINRRFDEFLEARKDENDSRASEWIEEFNQQENNSNQEKIMEKQIAESAGHLVEAVEQNLPYVSRDTVEKFKNSKFLQLMKNLRDEKTTIKRQL